MRLRLLNQRHRNIKNSSFCPFSSTFRAPSPRPQKPGDKQMRKQRRIMPAPKRAHRKKEKHARNSTQRSSSVPWNVCTVVEPRLEDRCLFVSRIFAQLRVGYEFFFWIEFGSIDFCRDKKARAQLAREVIRLHRSTHETYDVVVGIILGSLPPSLPFLSLPASTFPAGSPGCSFNSNRRNIRSSRRSIHTLLHRRSSSKERRDCFIIYVSARLFLLWF